MRLVLNYCVDADNTIYAVFDKKTKRILCMPKGDPKYIMLQVRNGSISKNDYNEVLKRAKLKAKFEINDVAAFKIT